MSKLFGWDLKLTLYYGLVQSLSPCVNTAGINPEDLQIRVCFSLLRKQGSIHNILFHHVTGLIQKPNGLFSYMSDLDFILHVVKRETLNLILQTLSRVHMCLSYTAFFSFNSFC